jgi:hypothetical protein
VAVGGLQSVAAGSGYSALLRVQGALGSRRALPALFTLTQR